MTEKERINLIIKDSCQRLPYGLKFFVDNTIPPRPSAADYMNGDVLDVVTADGIYIGDCDFPCIDVREKGSDAVLKVLTPYLRSMSTMTDEEEEEYRNLNYHEPGCMVFPKTQEGYEFLIRKHFDFMRYGDREQTMIELGAAIEAPEGLYK